MPKQKEVTPKDLRKFGIAFWVFLSLIGTVILWRRGWQPGMVTRTLYGIGSVFLAFSIVAPQRLATVFKGWMRFARALGWVNTNILLTLIYYVIFAPVSIMIRLFGGDLLGQRIRKQETSFWRSPDKHDHTIERYERQF